MQESDDEGAVDAIGTGDKSKRCTKCGKCHETSKFKKFWWKLIQGFWKEFW